MDDGGRQTGLEVLKQDTASGTGYDYRGSGKNGCQPDINICCSEKTHNNIIALRAYQLYGPFYKTQGPGFLHINKVGKVNRAQLEEIAAMKEPDLTAADMDAAVRTIADSARSMGIEREGVE